MANKQNISPNGEGRMDTNKGDVQFLFNYYHSIKRMALYYEVDYQDFVYAKDMYGKAPITIYYCYDENQNICDIVFDLGKVYEMVPQFNETYSSYEAFLYTLLNNHPTRGKYYFTEFVTKSIMGGGLVDDDKTTKCLLVKMMEYGYREDGNKLAHFADVLVDLFEVLNEMAGEDIEVRPMAKVQKDLVKLNLNGMAYFILAMVVVGLVLLIVSIIKDIVWLRVIAIIAMVFFGGWFGIAMIGLALSNKDFKSENFKETKCETPKKSRFSK